MSFESVERFEGLSLSIGPGHKAVLTTPIRCFQRGYSPSLVKIARAPARFNATCQDGGVTSARWLEDSRGLHREFSFSDFAEAWQFMSQVAHLAETLDHHPDWSNRWNRVSITLLSHDAGAVTERDRRMATLIDEIYLGES